MSGPYRTPGEKPLKIVCQHDWQGRYVDYEWSDDEYRYLDTQWVVYCPKCSMRASLLRTAWEWFKYHWR